MTQLSGAHAIRRFLRQFSPDFAQDIFKSCPNISIKFVKFKAELQKLDHLTCSKLRNMTSLYKPITLILRFYYMSNGLTFEILNMISRFFTDIRT